jgi:hypothetical protein
MSIDFPFDVRKQKVDVAKLIRLYAGYETGQLQAQIACQTLRQC